MRNARHTAAQNAQRWGANVSPALLCSSHDTLVGRGDAERVVSAARERSRHLRGRPGPRRAVSP
ncbi:hypothetical protein ACFPM0_24215 [Pseudonocardia sulfidoxydans]|uniref:hypothetical protein n=1 Tax=Pseudonocardia sulfidoxydans TaxID=54011 RepID=UPI003616F054